MFIFTNRPHPAEMLLSKPSSIKIGCYTCQWLGSVCKIWSKYTMCFTEELWAFSQTDRSHEKIIVLEKAKKYPTSPLQTNGINLVQTQGLCN